MRIVPNLFYKRLHRNKKLHTTPNKIPGRDKEDLSQKCDLLTRDRPIIGLVSVSVDILLSDNRIGNLGSNPIGPIYKS